MSNSPPPPPPLALLSALFEAQTKAKPVPKTSDFDADGKYGYHYASGADVVRYAKAHLNEHGLAVVITTTVSRPSEIPESAHRGVVALHGFLYHRASGETLPVGFELPYVGSKGRPDDKASQASIATGEARLYRLLLALTTSDQEDEVANGGAEDVPSYREPPTGPPAKKPPPAVKSEAPRREPPAEADPPPDRTEVAPQPAEWRDSTGGEIEAFEALAKRLGLSNDTAVTWASREPRRRADGTLSKMKDDPKPKMHSYNDAKERGQLAALIPLLQEEIDSLKERAINPRKSGWSEQVNTWSANKLGF